MLVPKKNLKRRQIFLINKVHDIEFQKQSDNHCDDLNSNLGSSAGINCKAERRLGMLVRSVKMGSVV